MLRRTDQVRPSAPGTVSHAHALPPPSGCRARRALWAPRSHKWDGDHPHRATRGCGCRRAAVSPPGRATATSSVLRGSPGVRSSVTSSSAGDAAVVGEPVRTASATNSACPSSNRAGRAGTLAHQGDGAAAHDRQLGAGVAVPLLSTHRAPGRPCARQYCRPGGADADLARPRARAGSTGPTGPAGRARRGLRRRSGRSDRSGGRRPAAPAGRAGRTPPSTATAVHAEQRGGHAGRPGRAGGQGHRSSCGSRRQEATHGDPADRHRPRPVGPAPCRRRKVPPTPVRPGCCRRATSPGPERASRAGGGSGGARARRVRAGHGRFGRQARRRPARGATVSGSPAQQLVGGALAARRSPAAAGRGTAAGSAAAAARRAAPGGTTDRRQPDPSTCAAARRSRRPARARCRPARRRAGRRDESCSASRMSASADSTMYWCARSRQPHLGGDDRLAARRERRVADRDLLVVGEVARLLLVGERVAAQEQREHEVGLLDHLLAVELQVGEVRVQRILLLGRARRSPTAAGQREAGVCGCTPSSSS